MPVVSDSGSSSSPRPDAGWEDGLVKLETRGPVAIGWLDHPPANALSPETVLALRRAWDALDGTPVRALVIASASSRLFCAGADIKAFTAMDEASGRAYVAGTHELLRAFERSSIVTIAAVNGLALGGGCELAMACDLRIAAESARFGQPEIKLGIIPGFGGTQRLARLVGRARALELNLVGDPLPAQDAAAWGLVNRVVPDGELLGAAVELAEALAARAPLAVEQIKRVSAHPDLDAGLAAEQAAFAHVFASADASEGIAAFLEKRPPAFRGR
jgi:enoyl-CoA hydratase/carnithine racemase